jgi:tetratricopeptide (TPR) repeat protein
MGPYTWIRSKASFAKKNGAVMKPMMNLVSMLAILSGVWLNAFLPVVADARPCEQWAATIVSIQGVVQVRKSGETQWVPVRLNETFCPGDIVRVNENSRAALVLSNETLLRFDQNTTISITGVEKEKTFFINLLKGAAHFFSRFPRRLNVVTPFVNAAVEGTEFYARVEPDQTYLSIFEGRVAASNEAGSLMLAGGQSAIARSGQAPALRVVVEPRDAVQWALYYPPIIDWRPSDFLGGGETDWQSLVRKSVTLYWKADIEGAFSALEKAREAIADPRFFLYRAALFLSVGRVEAANADISQALKFDLGNSYALALQAVIAVVQNKQEKAHQLATKAVETDPQSSVPRVALSYALQSQFDIRGALNSLQKAVELDPENALAWSRLAELYQSVGELDEAVRAARRAVGLNPHLARTQTVLGFALIAQVKIKDAKEAFHKAIKLDSAAPLPRLGLGLALIREGNLKSGRAEIEIAATLDPNSSLIRSYLGKAYYEEKRDELAADQYSLAKKLDPMDPTPWFYDAIRKQAINRPVEALHDLQKSIELNDNQAVFRSRLQLDQDLAARSASLGRIYNNLGFQQTGLVEGWKSVNIDPANYSAHRLLADLYAAIPKHQIARVSELLQSQLLQPINITPIQPLLAESDVFISENAGPTDLSFNEFNPLFLRNRFAVQPSAVVGNNETWGDEIVHSGLWNQFSYSLGQFHYQTNGFRENNDQEQDIITGFVQASLSPKTSIQGEVRLKDRSFGDLELLFDPTRFSPNLQQDQETDTLRLGFHHAFSPKSEVVVSAIGQKINENVKDSNISIATEIEEDTDGYLAEGQHLYRTRRFNTIAGLGYYDADLDQTIGLTSPLFPDSILMEDFDINHFNGYIYTYFKILSNLTLTAGISYDDFDDDRIDENQLNPKIGITWNLFPATTLRLAAFRVLRRTLIGDQTLEPTQVSGFNQFFDDFPGTDVREYGGAIDQKFFDNLFGGAEFYRRDLEVTFEDIYVTDPTPVFRKTDWDEYLGRAYLYWAPHPWLAFNTEYWYEKFDRGDEFPGTEEITELKTHRLQFGGNFFHPSGLFLGLKATYVNQEGEFVDPAFTSTVNDDDQFWLVDADLGYRLPRRYGIFSIQAKNLFDEDFNFQDTDPANPTIFPERQVLAQITLAF